MKRLSFVFCLLSLSLSSTAETWYAPTDGGWQGTSSGTMTIIDYDDSGNVKTDTLTVDKSGKIEGWKNYISKFSEDPGIVVALEAAKSASEAHMKIENISLRLDNDVITDMEIENGNIRFKKGTSKNKDDGWSDWSPLNQYQITGQNNIYWLETINDKGEWKKVGDASWYSAAVDNETMTRTATSNNLKVKCDNSKAISYSANGVGVSTSANGGIGYDGNNGLKVIPKQYGGIIVNNNGVSVQHDPTSILVDGAGVGVRLYQYGGIGKMADESGIFVRTKEDGGIGNGLYGIFVEVDENGGIECSSDGLGVKTDEDSITISDQGFLSVNAGFGLDVDEDLHADIGNGLAFSDAGAIEVSIGDGLGFTGEYAIKVLSSQNGAISVGNDGVGVKRDNKSIIVANENLKVGLSESSGMEIEDGGLTLKRDVPQPLSGWNGSEWVKILGGGAEPDEHSLSWVDPGHTNTIQIAGYNSRPAGDRVPVARGGGITWLPYNGGISINGANGTNYVFEAASDTAITFSVDSSVNPVKISVSVHWK